VKNTLLVLSRFAELRAKLFATDSVEAGHEGLLQREHDRRGVTLVELLIAVAILAILSMGLGGLSLAVHQGWNYAQGHRLAAQQGRVSLERITRAVREATSTPDHPGCYVVVDTSGSSTFPETLVVWRPSGTPANAEGPPLISECVFFCPDPADPSRLLEITAPGDSREIPLTDELGESSWQTILDDLKTSPSSQIVVLCDCLRAFPSGGGLSQPRGAVRFQREIMPSVAQWEAFRNDEVTWEELDWPQGVFENLGGLRQIWLRVELQLVPESTSGGGVTETVPLFGSACLYDDLQIGDK
jgi:prepilin-type N-terminal cleavage/methylation domain-containing protein